MTSDVHCPAIREVATDYADCTDSFPEDCLGCALVRTFGRLPPITQIARILFPEKNVPGGAEQKEQPGIPVALKFLICGICEICGPKKKEQPGIPDAL
jgi:hypothetical protein